MNKTVWTLWFQGWEQSPSLVKKCRESWIHHNPDWNVVSLDESNYREYVDLQKYIPGFNSDLVGKDQYADLIRTYLLLEHSGVWADATLFCNASLDPWLPSKTFLYSNPFPGRLIANWFISKGNDTVIDKWASVITDYWNQVVSSDNYPSTPGWHHNTFNFCYNNDAEFRHMWDSSPKMSCEVSTSKGPHLLTPYKKHFVEDYTEDTVSAISKRSHKMFKLTHKQEYTDNSIVPILFNTIK